MCLYLSGCGCASLSASTSASAPSSPSVSLLSVSRCFRPSLFPLCPLPSPSLSGARSLALSGLEQGRVGGAV
eukprot:853188-Rhodomonas_salina.1